MELDLDVSLVCGVLFFRTIGSLLLFFPADWEEVLVDGRGYADLEGRGA